MSNQLRNQSYGLAYNTPIDRVVLLISTRLELNDGYDYKLERWIKLLKDNWIQNAGALTRLTEGQLDKLNLPLGLKFELERIGKLDFKQPNLFHVAAATLVDSRYRLKLGEKQRELIHHSFKLLMKFQDAVTEFSGLKRFELEFFPKFFAINPGAQRLFHKKNLEQQSKAFVRMLFWIIENIESNDLSHVIVQLGGRHVIYQVANDEFAKMSEALCETLLGILGPKIFTPETKAAWEDMLHQMADLLMLGGQQCVKGIQMAVKRLKGKGAWDACYINLALDVLFIYKDKSMKSLVGQYPLKGVTGIEYTKDSSEPNSFQISSFDPPFSVNLATDDEANYKSLLGEFSWRIQAIQRAYGEDHLASLDASESDADGEKSLSHGYATLTSTGSTISLPERESKSARLGTAAIRDSAVNAKLPSNSAKSSEAKEPQPKTLKPTDNKGEKGAKKVTHGKSKADLTECAQYELELANLLKRGLTLSAEEKVLLKNSWTTLIDRKYPDENGVTKSGIGMLFDKFFQTFFQENPSGRRLFEHSGLQVQGRALVLMIGMIVKSLDSFAVFSDIVVQLGGRHEIYGVSEGDYSCFARVLSSSVAELLGGDNQEEVKAAWNNCMNNLSAIMMVSQKIALNTKESVVCHRKIGASSSWKQSAIRFALDNIYVFNGVEPTKLRSAINFKSIKDVDLLSKDEIDSSFPSPYAFLVTHREDREKAYFCFDSEEKCQKELESLSWRFQAQQRVYKYDVAEEMGDDHSGSNLSTGEKGKKLHFLKKNHKKGDK